MPDIGMIELILIGLIGFLVLGPERLPEFLGQIARVVRQGRSWVNSLKKQLEYEKHTLMQPVEDIKQDVQASVDEAKQDINASIDKAKDIQTTVEYKDK